MQNTQHQRVLQGVYLKSTYYPDCLFTSNTNVQFSADAWTPSEESETDLEIFAWE